MTKIRSQSSTRTKRGLGTVLWPINENMGTNMQAFYKHFYIGCLKTQNQPFNFVKKKKKKNSNLIVFFNSGRALCKSSRAQDGMGRVQHPWKYA